MSKTVITAGASIITGIMVPYSDYSYSTKYLKSTENDIANHLGLFWQILPTLLLALGPLLQDG